MNITACYRLEALIIIKRIVLLGILAVGLLFPASVFAHAQLSQATPEPDSNIQQAPEQVRLTFNERMENELYAIKVLDSDGESVRDRIAEMSVNQRELSLQLPDLDDGVYTVSYNIISADGHERTRKQATEGLPPIYPEEQCV